MNLVRRHPIISYLIASFLISYVMGIGAYFLLRSMQAALGLHLPNINDSIMRFGPSLAGLLIASVIGGAGSAARLIGRVFRWRAPVTAYLIAIFFPPVLTYSAMTLRGDAIGFHRVTLWSVFGVFFGQVAVTVIFGGLSEEIGWRGFMLPELSARYTPFTASALVALAWLAWHVPAYVLTNKDTSDPFLPFAAIMLPFCIVFTWIYYRSQESLFLPIVLHGSINASYYSLENVFPRVTEAAGFQPSFDWTVAAMWYIAALVLALAYRGQFGKSLDNATPHGGSIKAL